MPANDFLGGVAEVLQQVLPVGDLDRLRCALAGTVGVATASIAAHDLNARVFAQLGGEGVSGAVAQDVDILGADLRPRTRGRSRRVDVVSDRGRDDRPGLTAATTPVAVADGDRPSRATNNRPSGWELRADERGAGQGGKNDRGRASGCARRSPVTRTG